MILWNNLGTHLFWSYALGMWLNFNLNLRWNFLYLVNIVFYVRILKRVNLESVRYLSSPRLHNYYQFTNEEPYGSSLHCDFHLHVCTITISSLMTDLKDLAYIMTGYWEKKIIVYLYSTRPVQSHRIWVDLFL